MNITLNSNLIQLINDILQLNRFINEAMQMSQNLTLIKSLKNNGTDFVQQLNESQLIPQPLNKTILNLIYSSNPNFIYLYSNYSTPYSISPDIFALLVPQQFNFIANTSVLALLNANRITNQVYNATWIRNQMCFPNKNYLLNGSVYLNDYLCNNLNDSQLVSLFIDVSSQIDFTYVIQQLANSLLTNEQNLNLLNAVLLNLNAIQQVSS